MTGHILRAPLALIVLAVLGAGGCRSSPAHRDPAAIRPDTKAPVISADQARQLALDGALLLDVRTPEEFAAGHLDGAVNLPLQRIQAGEAPGVRLDRPVVVYCRSGRRSAQAAEALVERGFTRVHDLGPMPAAR